MNLKENGIIMTYLRHDKITCCDESFTFWDVFFNTKFYDLRKKYEIEKKDISKNKKPQNRN